LARIERVLVVCFSGKLFVLMGHLLGLQEHSRQKEMESDENGA